MKSKFFLVLYPFLILFSFASCNTNKSDNNDQELRYKFPQIIDITYTPNDSVRNYGWFTDAGSWMGFTIPQDEDWVNGFCGPFSIDFNRRQWLSDAVVKVAFEGDENHEFTTHSSNYFPGELTMTASSEQGSITQTLNFIDASNALLLIETEKDKRISLTAKNWQEDVEVFVNKNVVTAHHPSGEVVQLTFPINVVLTDLENNYKAVIQTEDLKTPVVISFFTSEKDYNANSHNSLAIVNNFEDEYIKNAERWGNYLSSVLRNDMKAEYDRVAAKAIVTLISNWRVARRALLHEGIVPSHAVGYFVGFWAWDSWRFSAALAGVHPELAKNNIRAMFDYQLEDGMIIDCIYTDAEENNARDSKPPLISWAVDEIFEATNDTAFVSEMYPQLIAYYDWWYAKRDINKNGLCEYGSTDGTLEAAAWESGMDNAIRFDNTVMLKDENYDDAWSMDQESVDLNAYLMLEHKLLKKFANIIGQDFDYPDRSEEVRDYFFDEESNFFFDRAVEDGSYIREFGCEAYTPLWTKVASKEQVEKMLPLLQDTTKFSTYIPFPTVAADNPKYNPRGYWRGPIWLDQTYFAIRGLRNYGYKELADEYTIQVFENLEGLLESAPIHENYGTHTGERLKAPHFSWSAAHLLMMYKDFGKTTEKE